MSPDAIRTLQFLAGTPNGNATLNQKDTHDLLLETGGNTLARGVLYNIDAKHIGAGVYKLTLSEANP